MRCPYCDKWLVVKPLYIDHIARHHPEEKP